MITVQSLTAMLEDPRGHEYHQHVIGRALVALFKRQTEMERQVNDTNLTNNVGFSSCDAKSGSITAKYYIKHKQLLDWQVGLWKKRGPNGQMRLCKYVRQLDEIASAKAGVAHKVDPVALTAKNPDQGELNLSLEQLKKEIFHSENSQAV